MTPPKAPEDGKIAAEGNMPPAVSLRVETLSKRADFQRATRSAHVAKPGFVLQMRRRRPEENVNAAIVRTGFTCSKKVGNAVARNRAKRRLREIARLALPHHGIAGNDYVLVGRKDATATLPFSQLQTDFLHALDILHGRKS
ncbi:Ribonuclease P protein component [Sulfitobacter noctilucicola]|uniref:Ribonuclease P protein component n=1 Tax=Sulfitobacter noctilucicola TaxID=1342301 RepID=A0A7W6Q4X9_9RHOB|nr:ribonuclease P protein component [Sulfitobacter noctilucicola]KIN62213.1 Ribonuclease P protein component [Sulfitobacter noctilucicola]MBB4173272.1 ribonuclease P protein component [Sulfitobacter noctilucicola]